MATAFVNAHITKALAAGAGAATIDAAWLGAVEEWARDEILFDSIEAWVNPAFGTTKDGSDIISRIELIGKPRMGWYTPTTASTTYSATGLNSTTPAFVNGANNAFGHFGGGRVNNIRRKTAITCVAAYQKSGTGVATFLGFGEFTNFYLQNTSGSPGSASFSANKTGTGSFSASATAGTVANGSAHIIGATYTSSQIIAFNEGVAGTPVSVGDADLLKGGLGGGSNIPFLSSGSARSKSTATTSTVGGGPYSFLDNNASFTASDLIVFGTDLSSTQMASLNVLLRARIGV
jgi:hypothetical protein